MMTATATKPEDPRIVANVDRARLLLAEARDPRDFKKIADMAKAAEVFARLQRCSQESIDYAHAIKIDAMTGLGEALRRTEKQHGARGNPGGQGAKIVESPKRTPQLADHGISKKQSSDAQVLAKIKTADPKLHEQVRNGKATVAQARVEVKRQRKREELATKTETTKRTATDWKVITGDVCEQLAKLTPATARLVFADPPYNIGVDYGAGRKADELPADRFVAWIESWVRLCREVLTPDGSFWLLISDEFAAESCVILKRYFALRNWIIWHESFGVNCADKFNRCKRHLFYAVRDPRRFVFHPDAVSRPSARQIVYNDGRAAPAGKLWDDVWNSIPRLAGTAKERAPDFPTQLPLELLTPIVGVASDPGDLVLDAFSGSGTTGEAAIAAGRRYLGIEKSAKFAEDSRARLRRVGA